MKKLLSLMLLSVVLSSCSLIKESAETSENTTETKESIADQVLDDQIISDAAKLLDKNSCQQIINQNKKEECINIINDLEIIKNSTQEKNIDLCKEIKLDRYKATCESQVTAILKEKEISDKKSEEFLKMYELQSKAAEEKDSKLCDSIADEMIKASCKFNIISIQAKEQNNSSLCDEIGPVEMISECKNGITN